MKKLILLFLLSLPILSFSQEKADTTKTELTKEQVYKDVKDVIAQLAEALKVGSEHVYALLVKQQMVNSVIRTIIYVSVSFVIFLLFYNGNKSIEAKADNETINWLMIPGVLLSLIFVIYFFATVGDTVTGFVNPEYGAIKEIISLIK